MMVVLMGVSGLAMADNGETCNCINTRSVSKQLSNMMQHAVVAKTNPAGAVMVQYTIDGNNRIHIEAMQSNSEILSTLVKNELEGKKIKMNGSQCTSGFLKINFTGAQQENINYFLY